MNLRLERLIWRRAGRICEYCRMSQDYDALPFFHHPHCFRHSAFELRVASGDHIFLSINTGRGACCSKHRRQQID